jgi:iron-sulfur cluster repair protein YtfE (RIC family)
MPVQIGAKTHSFNDPTGLLSDCHRRIEMFLGTLAAVAEVIDRAPSEETVQALQAALRYFSQAAPKHTADEEESLFPRLREVHDPQVTSAFSALDRLEKDHEAVSHLHAEVERLAAQYLADGSLSVTEREAFRAAVKNLQEMYKEHISVEDSIVFPLAAQMLSESDKAAIAHEMAQRRQAAVVVGIDIPRAGQ